jgi:hypothetical protein
MMSCKKEVTVVTVVTVVSESLLKEKCCIESFQKHRYYRYYRYLL